MRLFEHVSKWVMAIARSLKQIRGSITVEMCLGDVTAVLEHIRYGVVGHRSQVDPASATQTDHEDDESAVANTRDRQTYPTTYDRIHLSNIPDYIGGTLLSFVYALPVIRSGDSSYITSTCLRNPPRFKSEALFNNEYVALSSSADLRKVFQVHSGGSIADADEGLFGFKLPNPMPMNDYYYWNRTAAPTNLNQRLDRQQLETWLYRIFLKISIPVHKESIQDFVLIYSPLNMTMFFRILIHLHTVSYPAHWLGGVLEALLDGELLTGARAPRSEPLKIKETKDVMPLLKQSIRPFVAELSTLTSMWLPALPFGLLTSAIPPAGSVRKHSIKFDEVGDKAGNTPVFVLAFFKNSDKMLKPVNTLREILLADENGSRTALAKQTREKGLHILSTWQWHSQTRTATF